MIELLDKAFEELLTRDIPILNGEIDIKFDQPNRAWSARLSRPTVNIYLHDLRENQKLRQTRPMWETIKDESGIITQRQKPVRLDLHYIITVWASEAEDEHRLLLRTLMTLFRYPNLPREVLPQPLNNQQKPIPLQVAQYDELRNPTEVWQVLDNEMRPAIACITTIDLDPYQPMEVPFVRTRELIIGQSENPGQRRELLGNGAQPLWTIGGNILSDEPIELQDIQLKLIETGAPVNLHADGRFTIGKLRAGTYTLEISRAKGKPDHYQITVPAPDYEISLK